MKSEREERPQSKFKNRRREKESKKSFLKKRHLYEKRNSGKTSREFKTRRKRKESENCSKSVIYMKIEREKRSQRKFKARRKEKESE